MTSEIMRSINRRFLLALGVRIVTAARGPGEIAGQSARAFRASAKNSWPFAVALRNIRNCSQ